MKIYLDNCCFNRPFDDQLQLRIKLESEAKLKIQDEIRNNKLELVWSYILDYENSKNPFEERKAHISEWKNLSTVSIQANNKIVELANQLEHKGIKKFDALHLACAIDSECQYFLTTDDNILNKRHFIINTKIIDPFEFIKAMKL